MKVINTPKASLCNYFTTFCSHLWSGGCFYSINMVEVLYNGMVLHISSQCLLRFSNGKLVA